MVMMCRHRSSLSEGAITSNTSNSITESKIKETEDSLRLTLGLAGVRITDIRVTLDDGLLSVRALRRGPVQSIRYSRNFSIIHQIDPYESTATYEDGILTIRLTKRPVHPIVIPIEPSCPPPAPEHSFNISMDISDNNDVTVLLQPDGKLKVRAARLSKTFVSSRPILEPHAYLFESRLTIRGVLGSDDDVENESYEIPVTAA